MNVFTLAALATLTLSSVGTALAQPAPPVSYAPTDDVHFCGEYLPGYLPDVAQRWQKILSRRARYTDDLLALQRKAAVLFPIIEPILAQNAVPMDLKYLALVESELNNRAVSPRGAAGLWQLMPATARELGLTVRRHRDDRYDVRRSTQAACRYLWGLYRQTGSWMLAASAYNAGPNYIASLTRQFSVEHPLMLPFAKAETQLYVYQALAYKELLTRPELYGDILSNRTILALSQRTGVVSSAERETILASLEQPQPVSIPDMATATVVMVANSPAPAQTLANLRPVPVATALEVEKKPAPVSESISRFWPAVQTRSLTHEVISEGQLFVFEVTSPQTIDQVKLAVGDMVYAHIEVVDTRSGRVYLRADRVVSAQTREATPLRLMAVEANRKPGVPIPVRDALATGWQLAWEKI